MTRLSAKEFPLNPSPFGNLLHSPYEVDFGEPDSSAKIEVRNIKLRIGDAPHVASMKHIYELSGSSFPGEVELFDAYNIWIIIHTMGIIQQRGNAKIDATGFTVEFLKESQAYNISLIPQARFIKKAISDYENVLSLMLQGHAKPSRGENITSRELELFSNLRFGISDDPTLAAQVSLPILTPNIQTVGIGAAHAEWYFEKSDEPLSGDQLMIQSILVPKFTQRLHMKLQAYALIQPDWIPFPAKFTTDVLEVECVLTQ